MRLPFATRDSIPEDQRSVFDEMVAELGRIPQTGPGSVLIHVPKARAGEQALGRYLRRQSTLAKKTQELAMLVTARAMDCQYIWNQHASSARRAGRPDLLVDNLRERKRLPKLASDEAAVVSFGQEYFRTHRVSRGTFQAALEQFGREGLVELALIFGLYSLIALVCNSFDADLLPVKKSEGLLPI